MRWLLFFILLGSLAVVAEAPKLTPEEVHARVQAGNVTFLDVRDPSEIAEHGTLEGYINIPIKELEARYAELPLDKPVLTA